MCTADWEKIHFGGYEGEDVSAKYSETEPEIEVRISDYTVFFDMQPQCCEDFGVKFFYPNHEINCTGSLSDKMKEEISGNFKNIDKCELVYNKGDDFFRINFGEGRWIEFYNYQNGYYSHYLFIKKGDEMIFKSSL